MRLRVARGGWDSCPQCEAWNSFDERPMRVPAAKQYGYRAEFAYPDMFCLIRTSLLPNTQAFNCESYCIPILSFDTYEDTLLFFGE